MREPADEPLNRHIDRFTSGNFVRHTDEARQRGGDQHHFDQANAIRFALDIEQCADPAIRHEGKGMCRIERLRGNDRHDMIEEITAQPLVGCIVDPLLAFDMHAFGFQHGAQRFERLLLLGFELSHPFLDGGKLLARRAPVDRCLRHAAAHLPGQPCDADHREFVQIATRYGQEAQPFEQWVGRVAGFLQHAIVKGEPGQFAIEIELLWRTVARQGRIVRGGQVFRGAACHDFEVAAGRTGRKRIGRRT